MSGDSESRSIISAEIDELFGSGTVIVFTCASKKTYPLLSVSNNCEAILGFPSNYFTENPNAWSSRIHPEDRQRVDEQFQQVIKQGDAAINEYRFKRKDGIYIWLRDELKMVDKPQSNGPIIFGSSFDISDRKRTELVLRENKEQYESVVSHVKDIIFKVNVNGRLIFLNKTWIDRTGFSKEESREDFFWSFIHPDDQEGCREMHWSLVKEDVSSVTKILRCRRKDNGYFWAELYLKRLPGNTDNETAIIGTLVDVSADIARQQEIEAINKQLEKRVSQRSRELKDEIGKRKKAEQKLQQQLSYEQVLLKCSSLLLKETSPDSLRESLQALLEVSNSDRVYMYENIVEDGERCLAPVAEVCGKGVNSTIGRQGQCTKYADVPWWYKQLSEQKMIHAHVDEIPQPERSMLEGQQVKSVLALPVSVDGEWVGYVGFANIHEKAYWQKHEVSFLKTASQIIAAYEKRKRIEKTLVDQRNYTETLLNSLPSIYLLMDESLQLKQWNANAEHYSGYTSQELKQKTAFDLVAPEDHSLLKRAMNSENDQDDGVELTLQKKSGEKVPYTWQGSTLVLEGEEYLLSVGLDISHQKKTEKELRNEKRFNEALIESLPGIFYIINAEGKYQRWNQNFVEELGYSPEELAEMGPLDVFDEEEYERVNKEIRRVYEAGSSSVEALITTKSGKKVPYHFTGKLFSKEKHVCLIGVGYDITDQKKYEEKIQASLKEKNVLLQEIHHRVKNNLAVISGLLQLQIYESNDPTIKAILQESESRVQTMALIHEKLYQSQNLSRISCRSYLRDLINTIKSTHKAGKRIQLQIAIEDVKLNINKAVPFALLVNEVVTNSFKHAFPGQAAGIIKITLKEQEERIYVSISDDGVGLPEDFSVDQQDTLGMTLIKNFVKQLDAEWEFGSHNGIYLNLSFAADDIKGSSASSLL